MGLFLHWNSTITCKYGERYGLNERARSSHAHRAQHNQHVSCVSAKHTENRTHKRRKIYIYLNGNPAQKQNQNYTSALLSLFQANVDKWKVLIIFIFFPPRISICRFSLLCFTFLFKFSHICMYVCMCVRVTVGIASHRLNGSTLQLCESACEYHLFLEKKRVEY